MYVHSPDLHSTMCARCACCVHTSETSHIYKMRMPEYACNLRFFFFFSTLLDSFFLLLARIFLLPPTRFPSLSSFPVHAHISKRRCRFSTFWQIFFLPVRITFSKCLYHLLLGRWYGCDRARSHRNRCHLVRQAEPNINYKWSKFNVRESFKLNYASHIFRFHSLPHSICHSTPPSQFSLSFAKNFISILNRNLIFFSSSSSFSNPEKAAAAHTPRASANQAEATKMDSVFLLLDFIFSLLLFTAKMLWTFFFGCRWHRHCCIDIRRISCWCRSSSFYIYFFLIQHLISNFYLLRRIEFGSLFEFLRIFIASMAPFFRLFICIWCQTRQWWTLFRRTIGEWKRRGEKWQWKELLIGFSSLFKWIYCDLHRNEAHWQRDMIYTRKKIIQAAPLVCRAQCRCRIAQCEISKRATRKWIHTFFASHLFWHRAQIDSL